MINTTNIDVRPGLELRSAEQEQKQKGVLRPSVGKVDGG
jgi:hypothetical protein